MTDFAKSWTLSRGRFVAEIKDLNAEQLNWRLYPGALSIGEMALHVAGVEVSFSSQITGTELDEFGAKIKRSATEGVVNDLPFPYESSEIDPALVAKAIELAESLTKRLIEEPTADELEVQLKSALGPMISGEGALARFAFHPAYHQGQAYLIKQAPGFPA